MYYDTDSLIWYLMCHRLEFRIKTNNIFELFKDRHQWSAAISEKGLFLLVLIR